MSHVELYWFSPVSMSYPRSTRKCGWMGRQFYPEPPKQIKCSQALNEKLDHNSAITYIFVITSILAHIKIL